VFARFKEQGVAWLIVGPFAIILAFPFYWMLITSFKTSTDLYNSENVPFKFNPPCSPEEKCLPDWLPLGLENATYGNYTFLFESTQYRTWLENTALVGGVVVLITLLLAVPAGYALARLSGRWGQSVGVGIFLTYLVPPTLLFLPLSRVISDLGLQDQLTSLMLVYPSFTVPFSTWLLMGFFKTIPPELEDAARVDGASRLGTLARIVFPISIPGILTVVIFTFSLVVNEFVYAITFITTSTERTVSAGVPTELIRGDVFFWGALMAATLIPSIPLALLYNVFLNRFIAGFTGGAFR
jgi:multiple sugar transport system permease protein